MMKEEFEAMANETVKNEDWVLIQYVYQWHPSISNQNGKEQIVQIYKAGGMLTIKGMLKAAEIGEKIELELTELSEMMNIQKNRLARLTKGDMTLEDAIELVEKVYAESENADEFERQLKVQAVNARADDIRTAKKISRI